MPHQRPDRDNWHYASGWRCPLCLCTRFEPVIVTKPDGREYMTEFCKCNRCTVMFTDAERFARLGIPVSRGTGDVGPKTLAEAHHYWREALEKNV